MSSKNLLHTKQHREIKDRLERAGITLVDQDHSGGGHLRLTLERLGVRATAFVSGNPSNHRWLDNIATQCKAALRAKGAVFSITDPVTGEQEDLAPAPAGRAVLRAVPSAPPPTSEPEPAPPAKAKIGRAHV